MLGQDLEDVLDDFPLDTVRNYWFQEDGALAHNFTAVRQYLCERFLENGLESHSDLPWSASSPNLFRLFCGVICELKYTTKILKTGGIDFAQYEEFLIEIPLKC